MSATDELRALLDERGVEWVCYGYENRTWWNANGVFGWYAENRASTNGLFVKLEAVITPEQAIAATLGSDVKPCYATDYTHEHCRYSVNRGWIEDTKFYIPTFANRALTAEQVMGIAGKHQPDYCSDTHVCFDWQAIADELNATLGGGECEQVITDCHDGLMPPFTAHCSKCGAEWGFTPKFCPECGAKVVGTRDERKAVRR